MKIRNVILLGCVILAGCVTPEQRAAQQQQQLMLQAHQQEQIREQLVSYCEQYGFKRGTPEILECAARRGESLLQHQSAEDQRKAAWWACMGRVGGGFGNASAICNQNPNYVPPKPTQTNCMMVGPMLQCQSY